MIVIVARLVSYGSSKLQQQDDYFSNSSSLKTKVSTLPTGKHFNKDVTTYHPSN